MKQQLQKFLQEELRLELSEAKTLITHARSEAARFLGYQITTMHKDTKHTVRHACNGIQTDVRNINGVMGLKVPEDVVEAKCQSYMQKGKAIQRAELLRESDYTIILTYQLEFQGIANYYRLAYNMRSLNKLRWNMQVSLLKTLANKYKMPVQQVVKKYKAKIVVNGREYVGFQAKVGP